MKPVVQACSGKLGCESMPRASQAPSIPHPRTPPLLPYHFLFLSFLWFPSCRPQVESTKAYPLHHQGTPALPLPFFPHENSYLEDIPLLPGPCPLCLPSHAPRPSLPSPSSWLTEHTEPSTVALATLRKRGEVASVVGLILGLQAPHGQRCVPQLLAGPGGHEFPATRLEEAGAPLRVEDSYAIGSPRRVLPHPGHLRHLHGALLRLQLAQQRRIVAQEATHLSRR